MPLAGASASVTVAVTVWPSTALPLVSPVSEMPAFSFGSSCTVPALLLPVSAKPWVSVNDTATLIALPSSASPPFQLQPTPPTRRFSVVLPLAAGRRSGDGAAARRLVGLGRRRGNLLVLHRVAAGQAGKRDHVLVRIILHGPGALAAGLGKAVGVGERHRNA